MCVCVRALLQAERLIQGHGGSGAPSVPDVSAGLTQVSGSLRTLGNNLFAGTKEIIEQVSHTHTHTHTHTWPLLPTPTQPASATHTQ